MCMLLFSDTRFNLGFLFSFLYVILYNSNDVSFNWFGLASLVRVFGLIGFEREGLAGLEWSFYPEGLIGFALKY